MEFFNFQGVYCEEPPLTHNPVQVGPFNTTGTRYEDTTTYSCIEGYEITGTTFDSTTITCQSDKTWSSLSSCSSE